MVGGIAQEINARSEVLRIERELEEARGRLTAIRRAKYRGEGDSDAEGYNSGYESSFETSGYSNLRTNFNGSEVERSPQQQQQQTVHIPHAQESPAQVRQVIHQQQHQQRSESPATPPLRKQPPATPPRRSSAAPKPSQDSPLMMLQRQRHLIESTTSNVSESGCQDQQPSFSESLQKFNNSSSNSYANSSVSSFHSPAQDKSAGEKSYYTATVRNSSSEKVQQSHVTTRRTEKVVMSSSSKTYHLEEK